MNLSKVYMLFAVICVASCTATKSTQAPEEGLYKIAILYAGGDGKTFDMDYYVNKHMPMVAGFLGTNLKFYEIDTGISGRTPNDKPPYVAIGYFYCYNVEDYRKAISENRDAVMSDIKNYTNIQPVIQISRITQFVGGSKK